jgi:acetyl-CoA carboxylase biotin carboxyl carrier protein
LTALTTLDNEELIRLFEESDWQELALRVGDCELLLSKHGEADASWGTSGESATVPPEHAGESPAPVEDEGDRAPHHSPPAHSVVTAPSLGTFYRAAQPGAAPLVELGQPVGKDTELGRIEVMKRFTTLRAGVTGRVREVCAQDGELVEFAQPLFRIDTHG